MRRIVLNFHLFAAVLAGAFLVMQGITGGILAFEPELDRVLHPHLAYIKPAGQILSIREITGAVSHQMGEEPVVAYVPSLSPDISSEVLLPSGVAYVNPYTGELLGVRARGQTFLGYVRTLHLRLGGGTVGKNLLCLSAMVALLSVISGLYLGWPIRRMTLHLKAGPRRFWFDLHNVIGIYLFIPLTLLATSGIVLGFEDQAASLIYRITQSKPTQISSAERGTETGNSFIDVDAAVAIARSQIPGGVPSRVQMPRYGGLYRVELCNPHDRITGSRNVVAVDAVNGNVVSLSRAADLSRGDWVLAANEAMHTGEILGLPSRVVACLTSFLLAFQVLSGALVWLSRNKIFLTTGRMRQTGAL